MKFSTHLHPGPRLRMSGAIPPLHRYVFVARCFFKHRDKFNFYVTRVRMR
jgi:hypothetical protein